MEAIRPSSDLRNKYTELLKMLAEAQDDVDKGNVAPMRDTFDDIRKNLAARKPG